MRIQRFCILVTFFSASVSCHSRHSLDKDLKAVDAVLTYEATIKAVPANASTVRAWIPLPSASAFQAVGDLNVQPADATVVQDPIYGNRLLYLERHSPDDEPLKVTATYELVRRQQVAHPEDNDDDLMQRYLRPNRLGVIDKRVREMAAKAIEGKTGTMTRARAIYDYVLEHMEYNKATPGWGRGDTARACDVGQGNCSDYHSLFISLARAAGIPARFHYGLSLKPNGVAGAHCWAAFYDKKNGWVPVDISEADKAPEKAEYFFGHLSENRVQLTTGRDITLTPPQEGAPLNFLINPYVEVDGQTHDEVVYKASYRSTTQ